MTTDDERRRVAERLRELFGWSKVHCFDCQLAEAVMGDKFCHMPCDDCHSLLLAKLADLIEPSESVPGEVCEIEGTGEGEPLPPIVDREALLALADELETDGVDCYVVSEQYVLDEYASRIRKALGVVG